MILLTVMFLAAIAGAGIWVDSAIRKHRALARAKLAQEESALRNYEVMVAEYARGKGEVRR